MKPVASEHWFFDLYADDTGYLLEVVCGTVAVFTITIRLDADESRRYAERGLDSVRELADRVRASPSEFLGRRVG